MKKSLLLIIATFATLVASAHDFEVDGIYYNITSEEATTAEVTFKGDSYDSYYDEYSGSITLPAIVTHNGVEYSVTSIGNFAFYDCSSLTAITIPEGVTSIGEYAFWDCSSLTDITLPEGVTSIGYQAFIGCSSLTSITLPEGVTSIGDFAFRYCSSLTAITIPEGVTSIGEGAFEYCRSLTAITIPASVTSIGELAFEYCRSLTAITIPASVTSIGDYAFSYCSSLTAIIVEEGNEVYDSRNGCNAIIETNSNTLIQGCSTTIIPASVTSIGSYAFEGCSSLTAITIPESVKSIGGDAFYYCTSLKSITIPEGVTYIGSGAFAYCSSLTAIIVEEGNEVYDSRNGCNAIIETNSNTLIQGCSTTIIPEGVTSIGWSAFEGCSSLTAIAIPEGVTSIGNYAFWDCSSLTAITIPEGVTYIGEIAFQGCSSLTAITIPEGVTSFGIRTFKDCSSLTSITIPEGVTSIEHWAFYQCSSLTSITCKAVTPPTCSSDAFYGVDKSIPVYVPAGSVEAYKVAEGWSEFTNISMSVPITHITLSQSSATLTEGEDLTLTMTTNPENADRNLISWSSSNPCVATVDGQGKVTAQAPGTAIITATATDGSGASASCKVEVVAAQQHFYTITFLVDGKVYHQESLEYGSAIVAPEAPTKEGYTFSGWSNVPETMPANDVTVTGTFTAEEQPETEIIASGTCGDSLTWVLTEEYELVIEGTGAMYDYAANNVPWSDYRKSIQAVSLGEEMTSIGDYAFSNCTKLVAIAIPESVTSIGYRAFYRCSKLATVTITEESQLTSIGYAAFESCSNLTDITIPCGVTSIGEYAFFSCRKLTSITCYATTPPTIGGISTFYSVDKTIPVYVLDYTIAAYQSAKHWSEFTWFIGMETGINNSEIKNQKSDIIYDLHGRRITDTEGIKGIYIIDGRKVIIK